MALTGIESAIILTSLRCSHNKKHSLKNSLRNGNHFKSTWLHRSYSRCKCWFINFHFASSISEKNFFHLPLVFFFHHLWFRFHSAAESSPRGEKLHFDDCHLSSLFYLFLLLLLLHRRRYFRRKSRKKCDGKILLADINKLVQFAWQYSSDVDSNIGFTRDERALSGRREESTLDEMLRRTSKQLIRARHRLEQTTVNLASGDFTREGFNYLGF